MSSVAPHAVNRLTSIDEELLTVDSRLRTLAPHRARASLPSELMAALVDPADPPALEHALGTGIEAVYRAVVAAFPENIFWDLDALFASSMQQARVRGGPSWLAAHLGAVAQLQTLFGREPVNFRYIHDFAYGYDWAKWVAKDPDARASAKPFGPEFVAHMGRRGHELVALIARGDDDKYPPLPEAQPRNPFGFSREPRAEITLHRHLAERGELPVEAWRLDPALDWNRPYAEVRREAAVALGLS